MAYQAIDVPLDDQAGGRKAVERTLTVDTKDAEDGHVLRRDRRNSTLERDILFSSALVQVRPAERGPGIPRAPHVAKGYAFRAPNPGWALSEASAKLGSRWHTLALRLLVKHVKSLGESLILGNATVVRQRG